MRHRINSSWIAGLVLAAFCVPAGGARGDLSALLARLAGGDSSLSVLFALEGEPQDPRILQALEASFARGKTTEEKEWIAATLIRLGDSSTTYFDFLADPAKEAIEDRSPFFLKYDSAGNPVRGEFDAGFLNWCAVNNKNPRDVAKLQFGEYVNRLRTLAYAQDPRAREILRSGLESLNPVLVAYSVEGLGRLHDSASLPLIEKSLDRAKRADWPVIAKDLCRFGSPEAERLFERFVPDPSMRDFWRRQIQLGQGLEEKRRLQRMGKQI